MKSYELKHRYTSAVLHTGEADSFKSFIEKLVQGGANLSNVDLSNVDLSFTDLRSADLIFTNLIGVDLSNANLSYTDLRSADLSYTNLSNANLDNANLSNANLSYAYLSDAKLTGANLTNTDLSFTAFSGVDLSGADLSSILATVPVVERLHTRMLAAIEAGGQLNMSVWHTCQTTHCRAGWAIHLAGKEGYALEEKFGSNVAGALITLASYPFSRIVPNFYATDEDALADIRRYARIESEHEASKRG